KQKNIATPILYNSKNLDSNENNNLITISDSEKFKSKNNKIEDDLINNEWQYQDLINK
ncbi:14033_t:CDS:1, partial [Dentiscutata heterogama]